MLYFSAFTLISFFGISMLTYGFWWKRPTVIEPHEKINDIEYIINGTNTGNTVTVRVYLSTDKWNRKLWANGSLSINGLPIDSKHYNTWIASGDKYTHEIPKAPKYTLSLKREWEKEIIKVILAKSFSAKIPLKLYQDKENIIPFISEVPLIWEKIYINFSSLSRAPITKDANWYTHSESSIYAKIVNNNIVLTPEDIKNLLPWPMNISLGYIIKQKDGTYSIQNMEKIELIKE